MIDSSHSLALSRLKKNAVYISSSYSDLFTREIHFPLSSSNDRWKARYLSFVPVSTSFEMCWLMKKRRHR